MIDIDKLEKYIPGCIKQDDKSIEWLYRSFYGYLMGVALRYMENREVAEEVVNDSFMKILRNLDGFVFPDEKEIRMRSFKGWIARITSRTALDQIKIPYQKLKMTDISLAADVEYNESVLETIHAKDIMALLYLLPDIQRIIFNLHEIEGYRHEEIARDLGIEENVSRSYLSRARSKLKKLYHKNIKAAV
ncbi:RNA polymerase sigma factor [Pedobacter psychrodurus]|uniref:RNA polymerase sigma factor n=1 Tax=Pedobacter psychrodurus TaxID=2530456 RepID=A0A4R0Q9S1_9SPHI|nr:RNA polymerase sigma factor [Pedobacter psychrodurus]TCD28654.1 RNA polymerase sigma factor [Pedobacter psychrodurus]